MKILIVSVIKTTNPEKGQRQIIKVIVIKITKIITLTITELGITVIVANQVEVPRKVKKGEEKTSVTLRKIKTTLVIL